MPEQRKDLHWSLSFLVRHRFLGGLKEGGGNPKAPKAVALDESAFPFDMIIQRFL